MKNNHIKPRWRKVLVDFWENKARLALVIASIFIGVYSIGMIQVTSSILPASLQRTYEGSIPATSPSKPIPLTCLMMRSTAWHRSKVRTAERASSCGRVW
jgi:hypothetical protein